ncbi:transcriptional protein SWT1-like [Xyrauchen texanus]|uniref:transcriptional protein SWT1-like n=1 Tax=Xyrauchen texanus TaxID=154827 RepID=UPI0022422265|nr:transcriptional protein SWT1-like [Xyrauchen texanus]
MSSKKSKKKKHKKEERISSSSLREDDRKERDAKRLGGPKNKNKHRRRRHENSDKDKRRRAIDSQSTRKDSPKKERLKKTDVEIGKSKKESSPEGKATETSRTVFKLPITKEKERVNAKLMKHENASPHILGRSSNRHTATKQPSSKELEEQKQKLMLRRSAPEQLRSRPSQKDSSPEELQEKRKKLMKRSLSPEFHSEAKRRDIKNLTNSNLAKVTSKVLWEMRKKLVGRRYKEIDQTVGAKMKQSSHDKTVNDYSKEALPVVKYVDTGTKLKLPPCTKHHVQSNIAPSAILREERPSSGPMPKVNFKIPKKANAVKAQTKTDIWNVNLDSSDSRTQCNVGSPSISQQGQRPPKVFAQPSNKPLSLCSSHSLYLSQVKELQTDKTEATTPSNTPCKAEHITPQKDAETFDCDHEMQLVEELHLARSERRLVVNLVESCGELTCMDIDPPEEGASMMFNEEQHKQDLLIILDTNVLLSHLDFVKKIRSRGLGVLGFPTLLIPWVVLQELDSLKSGRLSSKVEDKARPAVQYIYCCLKNQEPRLMGQSMQLASQAVCETGVVNNDDRVLQCCLQYQALYQEGALVLCTNDKNLCSKALFSGVKALSKADLEVEGNRPTIINYPHVHPVVLPPAGPATKAEKEETQERRNNAVEKQELSECVSALESCLQWALSEVLEEEMKAAFGDLWIEIVYMKSPWNLDGVLQCFKKHWIAVFGNIMKRNLLTCVKSLSDFLCSDRSIEHRSVLSAVRRAIELLLGLAGRSQYSGHVDQALSTLQMLQQKLQFPQAPIEVEDNDTLMAELDEDVAPPPLTSYQDIWVLFESIWNNVCQISSALFSAFHYTPGTTEPSLLPTSSLPQEALSCLHRVSTVVKQLEALQRVLSVNSSVEDAQSLLSFIQASAIAAMEPRFTARDLFDCFSKQEYREKLCVGCSQLSELTANLDRCAAALSPWT